jgi:hypothetical protein
MNTAPNIMPNIIVTKYIPSQLTSEKPLNNFNQEGEKIENGEKGLTHFIRKHRLTPEDADKILATYPNISRYFGDIPHDWVELTGKENVKVIEKQVKEAFSDFAKKTYDNSSFFDTYEEECFELTRKLSKILNTPAFVNYLDEGESGKVFLVDVNNKFYALKTFHNLSKVGRERKGYGMQSETLDFPYISRNVPQKSNRYTKILYE